MAVSSLHRLRIWHALVAVLAVAAYLAEDVRPLHQWLGYAVVALIVIRLLMALLGSGPLGLQRFYPHFRDLRLGTLATNPAISRTLMLGIATCLLGVTATGVAMDRGKALGIATFQTSSPSLGDRAQPASIAQIGFDDDDDEAGDRRDRGGETRDGHDGNEWLEEVHELFANLLLGIVALHVAYLTLFKWPLARFMLFLGPKRKTPKGHAP